MRFVEKFLYKLKFTKILNEDQKWSKQVKHIFLMGKTKGLVKGQKQKECP